MKTTTFFATIALVFAAPISAAVGQTLRSDQPDYDAGAVVTLAAAGFAPGEVVTLDVVHADGIPATGANHVSWTVTADDGGGLVTW